MNLRTGLRNPPFEFAEYEVTSPPAIINGLVVIGSAVADNNRTDAATGEVRAYDARTGALKWSWDPVPQDAADPAHASWERPNAHRTGAANAWSVIAADPIRDLVFVPMSAPTRTTTEASGSAGTTMQTRLFRCAHQQAKSCGAAAELIVFRTRS